jgi:hypothetical protein
MTDDIAEAGVTLLIMLGIAGILFPKVRRWNAARRKTKS